MIALIGHGYIGEHIAQELKNQELEFTWLTHQDPIPKTVTSIINAAGYTGSPNVDACEIYRQDTIEGNVMWPYFLEMQNPGTPIVHISSGCVYTGYKAGGWTEDDYPNFDFDNGSFYSGSKALGQSVLDFFMTKSYLLRIRMPFGDHDHPKNFLTKMKNYPRLISYENSLSYVNDVARVAVHFAVTLPRPGIYNVCNPGSSNARDIVKMMGINKEWFTEDEFKKAVRAPRSNCVLNTDRLQSVFTLQDVNTALTKAIKNLNNN